MNKKQRIAGLVGVVFTITGFTVKVLYYYYGNYNFRLADALTTIFLVVGFSQLLLIKPILRPGITIAVVTLASFLFEIREYYSYGIADYENIAASIAGGIISYFIWSRVNSINKSKN